MTERKNHAKVSVQARTGRQVDELLRELYVEKRHTQQEIADAIGVHRRTVEAWLLEYGITRDARPAVSL